MKQLFDSLVGNIFGKAGTFPRKPHWREDPDALREAIIMHVDIVDSTGLVREDLVIAHRKVQRLYSRICTIAKQWNGTAREIRGDAAVIEFKTASDALSAAQVMQSTNILTNSSRIGLIEPKLRIGISQGTILCGSNTVTGEAVIVAQRLEQLAKPGEIIVDSRVKRALKDSSDFGLEHWGNELLKGFSQVAEIYRASFAPHKVLCPCAKF